VSREPLLVLNRNDVRALLDANALRPRRSLGQNFLVDANTARRIVRLAGIDATSNVLEIGPGLGSLTLALADCAARVLALEVDERLVRVVREVANDTPNVEIVHGDALEWPLDPNLGDAEWTCVSNLPYNVATPVVIRLLEGAPGVTRVLVMVQREVGERLAAQPGSSSYGAVSVKVAYHGEARVVGTVPPTVFLPRPKVESALVLIDRRSAPAVDVPSYDDLFSLVRAGFGQRRKMLRRALAPVLGDRTEAVLTAAGVAPTERAEHLGLDAWAAVAREAAR
jgi:16S rRNA (adenine1518-N6/adenine1519-N6)-dimethyltransferase